MDQPLLGKEYGTEVTRASLQIGFDQIRPNQIIALVHPDNLTSRRVIAKCSMTYVETIRLWRIDLMRHRLKME